MTGLEIALRHAFNERDEEIAKLRAEIAALTEQRDRAMAVVEAARSIKAANCIADRQLARARFWDALAALDTPSSPSLPESP